MKKAKRHRWKRAPGGHSCTDCGMFKATDGICFPPGGKRAVDSREKGVPSCKSTPVKT